MLKIYKTNNNTLILQMHFFQIKIHLIFCTYSFKDIGNYNNFYKNNVT